MDHAFRITGGPQEAPSGRLRIGCCAEIHEPNWRWVADAFARDPLDWTFFTTAPRNTVERFVQRPRLARYRACRELASAAVSGRFDLVITHHPLATCWTELFCRRRRTVPHVAFAFNFTRLPQGLRKRLMRRAFSSVDRFVVFSQFERSLYSSYFEIPDSRIEMVHWGVHDPGPWNDAARPCHSDCGADSNAICAVGSQGRDYATLLEAMRRIPKIKLNLVATAANLRKREASPANVDVRLDIPRREAQEIIGRSRFMVLPLLDSQVPCGHVTMVTAMFLSRAIIATDSSGITDYLTPGRNGLVVPPGDPRALAAAIERLWNDPELSARLGQAGREFALAHCTEARTIGYVRDLIERLRTGGRV